MEIELLIIKIIGWILIAICLLLELNDLFDVKRKNYYFDGANKDWDEKIQRIDKNSSLEEINTFINYTNLQHSPRYTRYYGAIIGAILLSIVY